MDLQTQVERIVGNMLPAVQALGTQLAGPARTTAERVDPRELERQCRDLGLAVGHELFVQLLQGYGDGKQGTTVACPCGGRHRWVATTTTFNLASAPSLGTS